MQAWEERPRIAKLAIQQALLDEWRGRLNALAEAIEANEDIGKNSDLLVAAKLVLLKLRYDAEK